MEVLGLLLELNVLEDEEIILRARIQDIVGGSPAKKTESSTGSGQEEGGSLFAGFEAINPDLENQAKGIVCM